MAHFCTKRTSLEAGSGYNAQNDMPVHIGVGSTGVVDLEVRVRDRAGRGSTAPLGGVKVPGT